MQTPEQPAKVAGPVRRSVPRSVAIGWKRRSLIGAVRVRLTADCRLPPNRQEQRAAAAAAQGAADQQRRRAEEAEAEHGRAVAQGAQLQGDLSALQARRPCALPAHLHPIAAVPGGDRPWLLLGSSACTCLQLDCLICCLHALVPQLAADY